jgi:hypothetical protein
VGAAVFNLTEFVIKVGAAVLLGGIKEIPTGLTGGSVTIPFTLCGGLGATVLPVMVEDTVGEIGTSVSAKFALDDKAMVGVSDGVADKRRATGDGLGNGVATATEPLADSLLLLRHLPAAQKPPTTAPPTSSEFNKSATTMTVIQN